MSMKQLITLTAVLLAPLVAQICAEELGKGFVTPPDSARPWVYLFVNDGNITRNGITADLEAMKRVGIGGMIYMEVEGGTPTGPAAFAGPRWRDLLQHLCGEAARLGLQVNMNNDAGWCGSGGPWITPELSMQKLVWTETFLQGPRLVEAVLPPPQAVSGFYRDITVLAFPTPEGEDLSMAEAAPRISASTGEPADKLQGLLDGKLETAVTLASPQLKLPQWVQLEFPHKYLARSLSLILSSSQYSHCSGEIQVSDDGLKFRTVRSFAGNPPELVVTLDAIEARWFRILFTAFSPPSWSMPTDKLALASMALLPVYRIENIRGKAAFTGFSAPALATFPTLPDSVVTRRSQIIDLTSKMDPEGKLRWEMPPGKWTVLRLGHTTTGKNNHPAPASGRGFECDKLSKEAMDVHFNGLLAKVIADAGPLAGESLVATHIDSWEVDSQNWTPKLRVEFQRLRGYDPLPLLPVVTGRVIDGSEVAERFLWDWRQTISELLAENYAGHLRTLANQPGLRLSIEAYGNGPFNSLTYAGRADEPMAEFWSYSLDNGGKDFGNNSLCVMASAGHIYGRKIIGAEAFTASWDEKWLGHPGNIKDLGDWAFCEGVNRFVFHRYAMQPWTNPDRFPGMSMGPFGLHYERTQTWWEQSKAWHEYLARCQYLLQQGLFVADIVYLQPEDAQAGFAPPPETTVAPHIRGGYNFDGCTPEVVLTRMTVKDGRIVLPDGMSYRVLVLPETETMTPPLLRKIKELVAAGATVIGGAKPPQKSPSLADMGAGDAEVKQLAGELWAGGKIVTGQTAPQLLATRGVKPDFSATPALRYIHRTLGDTEVYFVANPKSQEVEALCTFRIRGQQPELWHPDTGRMEVAAVFEEKDGVTRLPLRLDAAGSVFVVFRKSAGKVDSIVAVSRDGELLLPAPGKPPPIVVTKATYELPGRTRDVRVKVQALVDSGKRSFSVGDMAEGDDPAVQGVKTLVVEYLVEGTTFVAQGIDPEPIQLDIKQMAPRVRSVDAHINTAGNLWLEAQQAGNYELKTASGRTLRCEVGAVPPSVEVAGSWEVTFDPKWGGPAKPVTFEKLEDWSKHLEEGIRYYSGTATYRKTMSISPELIGKDRQLHLDLGDVAVMAEVKLNGTDLGILWKPPFRVDITDAVKAGVNTLEVKVVNLWVNRLIGDEQLPEDSDRVGDWGVLKSWPQWLEQGRASPAGRVTFGSLRLWTKNSPLQESGLLGPVRLFVSQRVLMN